MAAKIVEKKAADRSRSVATVLGIGTANPPNCLYQTEYPDFYFRVTNSDHKTELRAKFNRICEKSKITKRYFHMNEEILRANPNMCKYKAPSFDARQEMMKEEVPKLGKDASLKAIEDWGQPISNITHIVFNTSASVQIPGADYRLLQLLGLKPSVKRFLIIQQGCHAGGTALRLAKDLAENNSGARVLVVSVEITTMVFHAPSETHLDILVGQAIFSDGASATIIGADPVIDVERPLFQMVTASQTFIPHKGIGIVGELGEMGLSYYLSRNIPNYIGDNIKRIMIDTSPFEIFDFNSLFYVVHPGGPAIFDQIEKNLGLEEGKLEASRKVLSEYGNMGGSSIVFVLDEMRKKSIKEGKGTTGDGLEWGLFLSFGPGLTVETIMLKSVPIV